MSERKAINKWYPPDWDPSQAPRKKKSAAAEKVRLMLPFSMKCLLCNEYISARRKFNARKEVTSEKYMGIKIIQFHIKCPRCNGAIVFKTDPKTAGFVPVEGGVRNYESKAETKVKPVETEDEIFARLEREDAENQKFQEQRDKRKKNPFWQAQNKNPDKDALENLQDKLEDQQKEQEMYDHLAYLQAKSERMQQSGGSESVALQLHDQIVEKRKQELEEEEFAAKKKKVEKVARVERPKTVSAVITVKRRGNGRKRNGGVQQISMGPAISKAENEKEEKEKEEEEKEEEVNDHDTAAENKEAVGLEESLLTGVSSLAKNHLETLEGRAESEKTKTFQTAASKPVSQSEIESRSKSDSNSESSHATKAETTEVERETSVNSGLHSQTESRPSSSSPSANQHSSTPHSVNTSKKDCATLVVTSYEAGATEKRNSLEIPALGLLAAYSSDEED